MSAMTSSKMRIVLAAALAAAGLGLAGCSGGGSGMAIMQPSPVPPPRLEDQLGSNFGMSFRQGMAADPTDPMVGDLGAVSLTTEPLEVN